MSLAEYLQAWRGFDWRTANCAHFAMGWAKPQALDGVQMPGAAIELRHVLRVLGFKTLRYWVSSELGAPIAATMAQPGDVVLVGRSLGLSDGRWLWVPTADGALAVVPMARASCAWRKL